MRSEVQYWAGLTAPELRTLQRWGSTAPTHLLPTVPDTVAGGTECPLLTWLAKMVLFRCLFTAQRPAHSY